MAQYCASCAHKVSYLANHKAFGDDWYDLKQTVVCPHRICEKDLVVQIPVNSSHIKISRPHFQLFRPEPHPSLTASNKVTDVDVGTSINQGLHIGVSSYLDLQSTVFYYCVQVPDFGYLWTQFKNKFPNHEIVVCRQISQVHLL